MSGWKKVNKTTEMKIMGRECLFIRVQVYVIVKIKYGKK